MALLKNKYEISIWENLSQENDFGYTILTTKPVDWGNTVTGHYYYKNNNNWVQVTDEEWDDDTTYYTRFKKFKESKLAIIGSDTMTSECRALEPCLTSNINGTNTFTFKMFYTYIDTQTGKRVENSWIPLLMNEVYLKVYWKDKWYDFIIKNRVEDSSGKSVTFTCEDLFVNELSKTGFNLEFDTELENNQGTVFQLAERALVDTDWTLVKPQKNGTYPTVDGKTFAPEIIKQYTEEPVYLLKGAYVNHALDLQNVENSEDEITISAGDPILLFYSQVEKRETNLQFIYNGTENFPVDTNSLLITRNQVQRYEKRTGTGDFSWKEGTRVIDSVSTDCWIVSKSGFEIFWIPKTLSVSDKYRAERLVDSQSSIFDTHADKYVLIYQDKQNNNKKTYGFLKTDYDSSLMVTNCATWDDSGVEGWEESNGDLYWTLYPPFEKDTDVATYSSQGYLRVKNNQTVTNTGIEDHSTFLSDGLIAGQRYIVRFRSRIGNVNKPTSGWISTNNHRQYYNENIVVELKKYLKKSAGTFVENAFTLETNKYVWHGDQCWHEVGFLCNKSTPRKNLDDVIINVKWLNKNYPGTNTKYTLWITDFEFFPVIRDKDNNIIYPGDFAAQSRAMVRYYYYYPDDNTKAKSEDEIDYVYTASELNDTRFKKILNEDNAKVRSISVKQSNRFNILQTLAETFQCWAKFGINHDPNTGKIIIDETTGLPQKYITFVNSIGEDRGYGFVYGIDLKTIQRTIQSKQLVTKTIVQPNSNEFGQNGFCTISRAIDNVPKTNFIINLDYYVANGMLDGGTLANDLYSKVDDNLGYYIRLKEINTEYDKSLETYTKLKLELNQQEGLLDVYTKLVKSTTEELNSVEVDMMKLAGVSSINQATAYFQENFNDKTKALTNDRGQLSTKVQNYTKTRDTLEQAVNGEGGLKDRIEEIEELNKLYVKQIEDLDRAFNSKYSRYLQEGSWISEDYMDDDLYYLDGLNVAYTASRPQVQYSINVLRLTALEEFKNKIFDVGDIGFIEDKEFFGYEPDHITPIKEKIVVSQLASYFDSPERDTITIQNYKTQFEDLFQRITSTTQSLQFAQGEYAKTAGTLNSDMTIKADILQSSLKQNLKIVTDATNESVIQDSTGITIIDINNPNKQLKLTSGGLVFTNDGGITWTTGADAEGIRPNYLATGTINTDSITLGSLSTPTFRWSSEGISAYAWDTAAPELGVKTNQFVRFDQYGMYGIRGIQNFSADGQYKEVGSYIPAEQSDMSNWATLYVVAPGGSYEHADVVAPQWSPNIYYKLNDYPDFQSDPVIFYEKNITYQLLEDEPQSWDDVYIKDENGHYQQVAGEPSWSEDTYYEQIVGEGWIPLTEEPYDWGLNYTDYYKKVGNNYNLVPYELLTSETAPLDWEFKYYNYYIIIDNEMASVDGVAPTWQENTYFKRDIPSYEVNTYYQYTNGVYYKLLDDQPDDWYFAEGKYFEPVTDGIQAIKDNALFGFTWDGFFLKGDGDWISITSENGYEVFNPKWRFQEEAVSPNYNKSIDPTGDVYTTNDLIPVINLGRFYNTSIDANKLHYVYGLRLRDKKGYVTLSTDNEGAVWSLRQFRAGSGTYTDYVLLTQQPSDWNDNYNHYYEYSEEIEDFVPVMGNRASQAPEWVANTYYTTVDEGSIAGLNGTTLTNLEISHIAPILAKLGAINYYEVQEYDEEDPTSESNTFVQDVLDSVVKVWNGTDTEFTQQFWSQLYYIEDGEYVLNNSNIRVPGRVYYSRIPMSLLDFNEVNKINSNDPDWEATDPLPIGTYYVFSENLDLTEYAVRIWAGADETFSNSRFIVFKNGYVYAQQGYFEGSIYATNGNFSGKLTIGTGETHGIDGSESAPYIMWGGKENDNGIDSYRFYVDSHGFLYAQNATVEGTINVDSGILNQIYLNEDGTSGLSNNSHSIWINADEGTGYVLLTKKLWGYDEEQWNDENFRQSLYVRSGSKYIYNTDTIPFAELIKEPENWEENYVNYYYKEGDNYYQFTSQAYPPIWGSETYYYFKQYYLSGEPDNWSETYTNYYKYESSIETFVPLDEYEAYQDDKYYKYDTNAIDRSTGSFYLTDSGILYTSDIFLRGMIGIVPLNQPVYQNGYVYYKQEYTSLTRPVDWVNATYYKYNNETQEYELISTNPTYVAVTGETAPIWVVDTYYEKQEDEYILTLEEPVNWVTTYTNYYTQIKDPEPEGWRDGTYTIYQLTYQQLTAGTNYTIGDQIRDKVYINQSGQYKLILIDQYYKQGINDDNRGYVFWEGTFDDELVPTKMIYHFSVNQKGDVYAHNLTLGNSLDADSVKLTGTLQIGGITITSDPNGEGTIYNGSNWSINGEGKAKFESAEIRGLLKAVSFQKDSTSAVGGSLFISPTQVLNNTFIGVSILNTNKYRFTLNTTDASQNDFFGAEWFTVVEIQLRYNVEDDEGKLEEQVVPVELKHDDGHYFELENVSSLPQGTIFISTDETTSSIFLIASDVDTVSGMNYGPRIEMRGSVQNESTDKVILGNLNSRLLDTSFSAYNDSAGSGLYANNVYLEGRFFLPEAGITHEGTSGNSTRIWAGAEPEFMDEAPFRVTQDGSLYASKGIFKGTIEATDSVFSGWLKTVGILIDKEDDESTPSWEEDKFYVAYDNRYVLVTLTTKPDDWDAHYNEYYYQKKNGIYILNDDSHYVPNKFYKSTGQPLDVKDYILQIDKNGISIWEGGFSVYTDSTDNNGLPAYIYFDGNKNPLPYIKAVEDLTGSNYRLLTTKLQVAAATRELVEDQYRNQFYQGIGLTDNSIHFDYAVSGDSLTENDLWQSAKFTMSYTPPQEQNDIGSFQMNFNNSQYLILSEILDEEFQWSNNSNRLDVGITGYLDVKGKIETKEGIKLGTGLDNQIGIDGSYLDIKEYNSMYDTYTYATIAEAKSLKYSAWELDNDISISISDDKVWIVNIMYQTVSYNRLQITTDGDIKLGTDGNTYTIIYDHTTHWNGNSQIISFQDGQAIMDIELYNFINSNGTAVSYTWLYNTYYDSNYILTTEEPTNWATTYTNYYLRFYDSTERNAEFSGFDFFIE